MAQVEELIKAVVNKNPIEFQEIFNQIVGERSVEAIEEKRIEIAESIYGDSSEDEEEIQSEEVSEEETDEEEVDVENDENS